MNQRAAEFTEFLSGGKKQRNYTILDPSSYAAELAGRPGGYATFEDNLAFIQAFPNDSPVSGFCFPNDVFPELRWTRRVIRESGLTRLYEETLTLAGRSYRRVSEEQAGTTPWLVESAIKSPDDFDLIDHYADCVASRPDEFAAAVLAQLAPAASAGYLTGCTLLQGFEAYYLIDYPAMPVFFYDCPERYLRSIRKIQEANHRLIEVLPQRGCRFFATGSAGLELLSPRIFDEAIVPFVAELTDHIRACGGFSAYHICGHSRDLLESGRINRMRPTWFETFSTPPCGNNASLKDSLRFLDEGIISKGNLPLDLLRNGTPDDITRAVHDIVGQSEGRRHIVGQADGTILSGTPVENLRAYLSAAGQKPPSGGPS